MSREIKFRAWNRELKKMYDFLPLTIRVNAIEPTYWEPLLEKAQKAFDVMQYTGLKDKNGIEIYEGDIVEYKAYNIWHRDEVKFTDGKFHGNLNGVKEELQSRYDLGLIVTLGCEVIGNIYENSELLEDTQ